MISVYNYRYTLPLFAFNLPEDVRDIKLRYNYINSKPQTVAY